MVPGELQRKEFIMAYKSRKSYTNRGNAGKQQQSTRKETTSANVTNREFVVIASKSGRVCTFAENTLYVEENSSEYYNDVKLGMFERLLDVLCAIPTNDEELLDKQVAIYVPGAIFGNIGDMYRSDKYESCRDIMLEVHEAINDRNLNCFLVDITGSKATIVQNAYDYVEQASREANAKADGKEYVAPAKKSASSANSVIADKIAQLEVQLADAMIDGDDDKVARIESAIARLSKTAPKAKVEQLADELSQVEL